MVDDVCRVREFAIERALQFHTFHGKEVDAEKIVQTASTFERFLREDPLQAPEPVLVTTNLSKKKGLYLARTLIDQISDPSAFFDAVVEVVNGSWHREFYFGRFKEVPRTPPTGRHPYIWGPKIEIPSQAGIHQVEAEWKAS